MGDQIVCLRHNRRLGVVNGTRAQVTAVDVSAGAITASLPEHNRAVTLPRDYLDAEHVAHGGVSDCEALLHPCLELDFTDPGYGVVHHLVVAAYMLQHDAYSDTVRAAMTAFEHEHLDGPPTPMP